MAEVQEAGVGSAAASGAAEAVPVAPVAPEEAGCTPPEELVGVGKAAAVVESEGAEAAVAPEAED